MIYSVDLKEMAGRISFVDLCKYVGDIGWAKYRGKVAEGLAIYQKELNGKFYQIKVPCSREFSDYPESIYHAVETMAVTEDKSVEQIILELLNPMSDILRVRHIGKDVENGSILVEDAINLFDNAKKMLLNATLDILSYKKIHKGRIPEDVSKFINSCRYGQTEIGSYVISLVCPFMNINEGKIQQLSIFTEENISAYSLTRKATKKVIESINTIRESIERGEDLAELVDNPENSISVSFIESLTNMNLSQEDNAIEIRAKWAPTVFENKAHTDCARISHDHYSPLKTIVDKYKKEDEISTVVLDGRIAKLTASPKIEDRKNGQAQLVYIDENSQAKKVMLELGKDEYDIAIQAHSAGKTIRASGEFSGKKMINVSLDILG